MCTKLENSSSIYSEINSALEMEKSDQYSLNFIFNTHSIVCFLPAFFWEDELLWNEMLPRSEHCVSLCIEISFFFFFFTTTPD